MAVSSSSFLVEEGAPGLRVDPHDRAGRGGVVGTAAQQRADPGQQLGQPERLGDVVVGAGVEADHGVHLVRPGGEDQHRDRPAVGTDPPAHLEAVDVRQAEVEDHQVRALVGTFEGGAAVAADVDVITLAPQRSGEWLGDRGVIFGQEDTGHVRIVER